MDRLGVMGTFGFVGRNGFMCRLGFMGASGFIQWIGSMGSLASGGFAGCKQRFGGSRGKHCVCSCCEDLFHVKVWIH